MGGDLRSAALLGGVLVAALDGPLSARHALRAAWIVPGVAQLVVAVVAMPRLTTAKMDAARAAAERAEPAPAP